MLLAGQPGVRAPSLVKIFRLRQKHEKGAKICNTNDARTPFVSRNSEFRKTEELFKSASYFYIYR